MYGELRVRCENHTYSYTEHNNLDYTLYSTDKIRSVTTVIQIQNTVVFLPDTYVPGDLISSCINRKRD